MSALSRRVAGVAVCLAIGVVLAAQGTTGPSGPPGRFVDITWMSFSNMLYEIGGTHILTDGYFTRLRQEHFYGGGGGLAYTKSPSKPDVAAVTRVMNALGGPSSVHLLLTGHSHWDHSFDTATWFTLTLAPIIGSQTTCLQARAQGVPADKCRAVSGREVIPVAPGVAMHVVRWNHSGDPAVNPEQHNPVELTAPPALDPATGGLRAGVAEDFPNGGGNRAFLFTVDAPEGRFSWFFNNSASAVDLHVPIVLDGSEHGAPLDNLKSAMTAAGLSSVDLWIGSGGPAVAKLVVPVLKPKAFLPVHWDGLWGAFEAGVPKPYADAALEGYLKEAGVALVRPQQYMDKWRLDATGIRPIPNAEVKATLGFK